MKADKRNNSTSIMPLINAVIAVALLALVLLGLPDRPGAQAAPTTDATDVGFSQVDIDAYVEGQRPLKKGTTLLLQPRPVGFIASLKQYPAERQVRYLHEVLDMFPMEPRPEVRHRMFVTTPGGHIMPVYVEHSQVARIREQLKEDGEVVRFFGYHLYNYSKGPAILVTGFAHRE